VQPAVHGVIDTGDTIAAMADAPLEMVAHAFDRGGRSGIVPAAIARMGRFANHFANQFPDTGQHGTTRRSQIIVTNQHKTT
jgi:hypothetical protein